MLIVLLGACSTKDKPPPPRPELIDVVRDLADRACACGTSRACVSPVRDEWDAQKRDLQNHGLTGDDKAAFDTELARFRACGDAAGLTIWQ